MVTDQANTAEENVTGMAQYAWHGTVGPTGWFWDGMSGSHGVDRLEPT